MATSVGQMVAGFPAYPPTAVIVGKNYLLRNTKAHFNMFIRQRGNGRCLVGRIVIGIPTNPPTHEHAENYLPLPLGKESKHRPVVRLSYTL